MPVALSQLDQARLCVGMLVALACLSPEIDKSQIKTHERTGFARGGCYESANVYW